MREARMHTEHVVFEIKIEQDGERHTATYFVENGTIHAHIAGRTFLFPIGGKPPEEVLRKMLKGVSPKMAGSHELPNAPAE